MVNVRWESSKNKVEFQSQSDDPQIRLNRADTIGKLMRFADAATAKEYKRLIHCEDVGGYSVAAVAVRRRK